MNFKKKLNADKYAFFSKTSKTLKFCAGNFWNTFWPFCQEQVDRFVEAILTLSVHVMSPNSNGSTADMCGIVLLRVENKSHFVGCSQNGLLIKLIIQLSVMGILVNGMEKYMVMF